MRIGIDAHMIGDHSGGNESYYKNVLMNMDTGDDEVFLFLKKGIDDGPYADRFSVVRFQEESAFKRNFFEIPELCRKYNLDVLHMQYFIPFSCVCPVVCTIHDICYEHYSGIFTRGEYIRQKLLIPYAARRSKAIFTVSDFSKDDIVRHYGVDASKVYVTYNAADSSFRKLSDEELKEAELRERYDIGDCKYILSVGNLQPRKNLPRLIRAFVNMRKDMDEDIKLVIVGKRAWLAEEIMAEAAGSSECVILTDYVEGVDLTRLYNAAECFVYPSFFEGFGIPPLEAMACGTPVAVADRTSLPEVVGDAGLYFDPFDEEAIRHAMEILLSDASKRDGLIKKGFERVKYFDWKRSADTIMEVYHSVGK